METRHVFLRQRSKPGTQHKTIQNTFDNFSILIISDLPLFPHSSAYKSLSSKIRLPYQ